MVPFISLQPSAIRYMIEDSSSTKHLLDSGVPQGSVLDPIQAILYLLYTSPLKEILRKHGVAYNLYTDDIQLHVTFSINNNEDLAARKLTMIHCLLDIEQWMYQNKLKLNNIC